MVYPDSVPTPAGDEPLGEEPEFELLPMLGQSLVEPDEDDPVELLEGVELVELEEFEPEEFVLEPVLEVLVAALATSAPPVMSPAVRAPAAIALRR